MERSSGRADDPSPSPPLFLRGKKWTHAVPGFHFGAMRNLTLGPYNQKKSVSG